LVALPPEILQSICEKGEGAAREYVYSRVERKLVRSLDIRITTVDRGGLQFSVDVFLEIDEALGEDVEEIAEMASEAALEAVDREMRSINIGKTD